MINIQDPRFRAIDKRILYGEIDDKKVGVVLATMSANYDTPALNVGELNCLSVGKAAGKIDEAWVVGVKDDGTTRTVVGEMKLEEALPKLNGLESRNGPFGPFWVLRGFFDEPF